MIDNADITIDELIKIVKGPDFPTGAVILGKTGMREAYRTRRERVADGALLVLIGRRRILDATSGDVCAEFERTCRRAGVWVD